MATLVVTIERQPPRYYILKNIFLIGSGKDNDLILSGEGVSEAHAIIRCENGKYFLIDLNSPGGTFVDGKRVGRIELHDEMEITIGDAKIVFKAGEEADETIVVRSTGSGAAQESKPTDEIQGDVAAERTIVEADREILSKISRDLASSRSEEPTVLEAAEDLKTKILERPPEAKKTAAAKLVVLSGQRDLGKEYLLKADKTTIGKAKTNHIVIEDEYVSNRHAMVVNEDGSFTIVDLDSTNGVLLNGKRIRREKLKPNDIITVGLTELRFVIEGAEGSLAVSAGAKPALRALRVWFLAGIALAVFLLILVVGRGLLSLGEKGEKSGGSGKNDGVESVRNAEVWLREGEQHLRAGRWQQAIESLKKVPSDSSGFADAQRHIRAAQAEIQNEKNFRQVMDQLGQGSPSQAMEAFRLIPDNSFYHGKAKEALIGFHLDRLKRAVDVGKKTENERLDYDYVLGEANAVLSLDDKNITALLYLCLARLGRGEYDKVIEAANRVLALDPRQTLAYYYLCSAYLNLREYERVIESAGRAIELDPNQASWYILRGDALLRGGRLDQARSDFEKALKMDPGNELARSLLDKADLLREQQRGGRRAPAVSAGKVIDQAKGLYASGKIDEAISGLNMSLKDRSLPQRDRREVQILSSLLGQIQLYYDAGRKLYDVDKPAAFQYWEKLLEAEKKLNLDSPSYYRRDVVAKMCEYLYERAKFDFSSREFLRAYNLCDKILALDHQHAGARDLLARINKMAEDYYNQAFSLYNKDRKAEEARRYLLMVLDMVPPDNIWHKKSQEKLGELR